MDGIRRERSFERLRQNNLAIDNAIHSGLLPRFAVYDIGADEAWVSVGTDHDTSAFAVQTIQRWWFGMGCQRYPAAKQLVITADGGRQQRASCAPVEV